jgi:hypothetical protein
MPDTPDIRSPSEADLHLWREAMTHLRHLSDDVFKSVVFFVTVNLALLGGIVYVTFVSGVAKGGSICIAGCLVGIALTVAARFLLRRHRIYYLEMLAKKSLLEMELGFYDRKFAGTEVDFAIPWRLKPEVVRDIAEDFDGWVQRSIRSKGTMVRIYFLFYEALIAIYAILICWVLWRS